MTTFDPAPADARTHAAAVRGGPATTLREEPTTPRRGGAAGSLGNAPATDPLATPWRGPADQPGRPGGILRYLGSAGISVVFHGVALVLLSAATWAVGAAGEPVRTEFQARVVQVGKTVGPSGGFRFHGEAHVDREDGRDAPEEVETLEDLAALLAGDVTKPASGAATEDDRGLSVLSAGGLGRSDIIGIGTGGGRGGAAEGEGLGSGGVVGGGPVGGLWGVGAGQRATSVVYVLDRSGSMADIFHLLKKELKKAIGTLEADQKFNVIWFKENDYTELFSRLTSAKVANKRRAFRQINDLIQPEGQTDPVAAIRRAFSYRPDVVFLVSDADFHVNNARVVRIIGEMNRSRSTTVNTILIVYDAGGGGSRVDEAVHLFQSIAEANGGTYKRVTDEDFGNQ